jgi:hypothetical protein
MIYLTDFFAIFGVLIAITLSITFISHTVRYIRGIKPTNLFTKDKIRGITWALIKLTLIIFLLRQAILYDGLWWLALLISTAISEYANDKRKKKLL